MEAGEVVMGEVPQYDERAGKGVPHHQGGSGGGGRGQVQRVRLA